MDRWIGVSNECDVVSQQMDEVDGLKLSGRQEKVGNKQNT